MNFANTKKYLPLLKELVSRDVKIKYRRSFLGMMWTVLNPLGMMVVMTIVFSTFFKQAIPHFPVYLMCGQLIFNFFSEASNMGMSSIIGNAGLIKKVYVPKYFFPISRVLSSFVNLVTSFIALLIVIIVTRTPVHLTMLLVIFPVIYVLLFSMGVGLILSAIVVSFRDMIHLYGVLLTAWMYLTPIFYPTSMLEGANTRVARLALFIVTHNPLTLFVDMMRDVILYNNIPTLMDHVKCGSICLVVVAIGLFVFKKLQDGFILKI
ncbi:MAG: ABC transporter permease [Lachnospiraceae bacterium]|nr:ABC transporter permease [Lachnospiraceae bacterium]